MSNLSQTSIASASLSQSRKLYTTTVFDRYSPSEAQKVSFVGSCTLLAGPHVFVDCKFYLLSANSTPAIIVKPPAAAKIKIPDVAKSPKKTDDDKPSPQSAIAPFLPNPSPDSATGPSPRLFYPMYHGGPSEKGPGSGFARPMVPFNYGPGGAQYGPGGVMVISFNLGWSKRIWCIFAVSS